MLLIKSPTIAAGSDQAWVKDLPQDPILASILSALWPHTLSTPPAQTRVCCVAPTYNSWPALALPVAKQPAPPAAQPAIPPAAAPSKKAAKLRREERLDKECTMCLEMLPFVAFLPCKHRVMCKGCADKWMARKALCSHCSKPIAGIEI
eukprot:1141451-Pelagomonas_calceolata.AAC.2